MSAALQLPIAWSQATARPPWPVEEEAQFLPETPELELINIEEEEEHEEQGPYVSLAFYRKHTEDLLRRYLYASMVVGRTPSIMNELERGGRATCTRLRTFEDAVIFVLDIENCLRKLSPLDRTLLSRIILQEYTHQETADMLGMSLRAVLYKLHQALDRTTDLLLDSGLLELPRD